MLIINYIDRVWETFGKHLFHVLHILLPCANRLFSIPFYTSFNYFCFWGLILTASHACLHVLQILLAKLTNNLQNTKLPASYSRFSCKISRFLDGQTPNHILQGAVSLFSKKKRIARPCGLGLSLERLIYIIR